VKKKYKKPVIKKKLRTSFFKETNEELSTTLLNDSFLLACTPTAACCGWVC